MGLRRLTRNVTWNVTWGVLAGCLALSVFGVAPASAEFFGCNEPHTTVSYSPGYYPHRSASHSVRQYSAKRLRQAAYAARHAERRDHADGSR